MRAVQLVREPGEVEKDQKIHAKPEQRSREIQTVSLICIHTEGIMYKNKTLRTKILENTQTNKN